MRYPAIILALLPTPAMAHWGHLGEAAAHSHWIAAGALLAAAAIAAALAKGKTDSTAEGDDAEAQEAEA